MTVGKEEQSDLARLPGQSGGGLLGAEVTSLPVATLCLPGEEAVCPPPDRDLQAGPHLLCVSPCPPRRLLCA